MNFRNFFTTRARIARPLITVIDKATDFFALRSNLLNQVRFAQWLNYAVLQFALV